MRRRARLLPLLTTSLLMITACRPAAPPRLDGANLALLRLEYLELAENLPAVNLQQIEIPDTATPSRFSEMVWEVRSDDIPKHELFRPLPVEDLDLILYASLTRTLEDFGFTVRGWPGLPELRMRVEVARCFLLSEDGDRDRSVCDLDLVFLVEEYASGLAIDRFEASARLEQPGSGLVMQAGEPHWAPDGDPLALTAVEATQHFLYRSRDFWKDPRHWRDGQVRLTAAHR
ncbi:MAG: hypothetical protein JW819_06320 [Candidatus Krumholzibacteriota bacterium]|nr:hypothetical protein [Candidatus Krumholzibacteriota bacterium]